MNCLICQMDKSSKPVILEPGCCNKWLHLDCLKLILLTGGNKCPSCSTPFPSSLLNIAQPQPQPQPSLAYSPTQPSYSPTPPPPQPPMSPQPIPVLQANPVMQQQQQYPVIEAFALNPPQINYIPSQISPPLQTGYYPPPMMRGNRGHPRDSGRYGVSSLALRPEDPIDLWIPTLKQDSNFTPNRENETNITSRCIPEVPEISLNSMNNFHTLVSFSSTACDNSSSNISIESRPPMDIVCVLDTSGSMGSDNKLTNLKHAINYIRGELHDNDRLSIITFSSSSQLVHNLLRMNDENKMNTQRSVSDLCASGGTSILSGLQTAYQILSNRKQANPITSVFLLTDGIDSSYMKEKKQTAQMIKDMGSSLFVFGFGKDHDSAHLQAIADAADGMFTFIEKSDMVIDAFGGALGAEQSIFATDIELHLSTVNGTKIIQVESGMYTNTISSDRSSAIIFYKNLMIGEERDVLVLMDIPPVDESMNGQSQGLLRTCIKYRPLGRLESDGLLESIGGDCVVKRLHESNLNSNQMRNELVDVQINRLNLTHATKLSIDLADSRKYQDARRVLEEALTNMRNSSSANNIKTQAFILELQMALNDVSSETEFTRGGGRSNMSEKAQNYSRQRMCYAKSASPAIYQNTSSATNQGRANFSKQAF